MSKLLKHKDSFLSPTKARRKRRHKKQREPSQEENIPTTDKGGGQNGSYLELKENKGKDPCGVGDEENEKQKGQRRCENLENMQTGLHKKEFSTNQRAETIGEASKRLCKLPPLENTYNNGMTFETSKRAHEHLLLGGKSHESEENKLGHGLISIPTVGIYDLSDLRKQLKLKKENPEGILKVNRDVSSLRQVQNGCYSDSKNSTAKQEVSDKAHKKVRFVSVAHKEDTKCSRYTIHTVALPLDLVYLKQKASARTQTETKSVSFPRIVDQKACTRVPFTGNRKVSQSSSKFGHHDKAMWKRHKLKQTDPESVECRGEACFPGFLSLPLVEKVTDWLTQ